MRLLRLAILIALAGCTEFPVLDSRLDAAARDAPYPQLTDIAPLIAQANVSPPSAGAAIVADMDARIAQLNQRARMLRGAIIETATRARMRRGVNTAALL